MLLPILLGILEISWRHTTKSEDPQHYVAQAHLSCCSALASLSPRNRIGVFVAGIVV